MAPSWEDALQASAVDHLVCSHDHKFIISMLIIPPNFHFLRLVNVLFFIITTQKMTPTWEIVTMVESALTWASYSLPPDIPSFINDLSGFLNSGWDTLNSLLSDGRR